MIQSKRFPGPLAWALALCNAAGPVLSRRGGGAMIEWQHNPHPCPLPVRGEGDGKRRIALFYGLALAFLVSGVPALAQSNVFITELMALNSGTLADQDGDFSDWIEIYNAGPGSVDLNGWSLKDSSSTWQFPQTNLAP